MRKKFVREKYASLGKGENNDCVVRATAIALGLEYDHVHAVFAAHGRTPGRRTKRHVSAAVFAELFPCIAREFAIKDANRFQTLAQFRKGHKTGRFIVFVRGHALALVNGTVHDWTPGPRRRVQMFWNVSFFSKGGE